MSGSKLAQQLALPRRRPFKKPKREEPILMELTEEMIKAPGFPKEWLKPAKPARKAKKKAKR